MMTRILAAGLAAALIAFASTCPAQAAATKKPGKAAGVRLTYELPVDAMQRTLQKNRDSSMETLLTEAVESVRRRLSTSAKVARLGAASFTVEADTASAEELAELREVIETIGSLEFRIVANSTYKKADLQLTEERKRMEQWLNKGGRKRLLKDPDTITAYKPRNGRLVRWVVRTIEQNDGKWAYALSKLPQTEAATVALFDDFEWNDGHVPAGQDNEQAALLELVAINMHEIGFTERDLDPRHTRVTTAGLGGPGVLYRIVAAKQEMYADWTGNYVNQACAVILNGELLSAPIFRSKIIGKGIIQGSFDEDEAKAYAAALRSGALPAKPKLVRQEVVPAKAGK